jgi:hypothetical protein
MSINTTHDRCRSDHPSSIQVHAADADLGEDKPVMGLELHAPIKSLNEIYIDDTSSTRAG